MYEVTGHRIVWTWGRGQCSEGGGPMAGKHGGPPATQDKDTAAPDQKRRQEEQSISYMSRIISTSRISNDNTQPYVVFGALLTFAFLEAKMFIDIFDLSSMGFLELG